MISILSMFFEFHFVLNFQSAVTELISFRKGGINRTAYKEKRSQNTIIVKEKSKSHLKSLVSYCILPAKANYLNEMGIYFV